MIFIIETLKVELFSENYRYANSLPYALTISRVYANEKYVV